MPSTVPGAVCALGIAPRADLPADSAASQLGEYTQIQKEDALYVFCK